MHNIAVPGGFQVPYFTNDGTATVLNSDYVDNDGVLTFTGFAGESKTINVTVNGDNIVENNETFTVSLGAVAGVTISGSPQTATIVNDDAATLTLSGGGSTFEGDSGTTARTFTATLDNPVQGGFQVTFATNDGTATTANGDYVDNDGTLSFAGASAESKPIVVLINGDTAVEGDETFTVALAALLGAPAGVSISGSPQLATILNDDAAASAVNVSVAPTASAEDTGPDLVYTFSRSAVSSSQHTVNFSITGTSASDDYVLTGATFVNNHWEVVIPANQSSATVTLNPTPDNVVEPNETAILTVLAGSGYTIGSSASATGTINNDDSATLTLSGGGSANEGNAGNTIRTFTATLSNPVQGGFQVPHTTNDGTATANSDYVDNDGTLTFAGTSNETQTISVAVVGDTTPENDETFTVALGAIIGAPAGVSIAGSPQTATIKNDDVTVGVAVSGSPAAENGGTLTYTFTRTGDTGAALPVTFSGAGTATFGAGNDYLASSSAAGFTFNGSSGTITIPAGQASATMTITGLDDALLEGNENVLITVTASAGYVVSGTAANGVITDDETATISISKTSDGAESSAATYGTFRVTLSRASSTDTVVNYSFGGTASALDYTASNSVIIPANNLSADIVVTVINDRLVEGTETVLATLVGTNNPAITIANGSATLSIIDNDSANVAFQLASNSVSENAGSATVGVQLTLVPDASGTGPVQLAQNVAIDVRDVTVAGAGKATAGSDYTFTSPTTVTFSAGVNYTIPFSTPVSVAITNDSLVEADETLDLQLANLVDTTGQVSLVAPINHSLTILDNDAALVSIAAQVASGSEASTPTNGKFRVSLSQASSTATVIAYSVGGTATSGSDFTALSGTVTIPAGALFADFDVSVLNDTVVEGTETVVVTLSSITSGDANIAIDNANKTATVNIVDNDTATLAIAATTNVSEAGGAQSIPVTLTTSDGAGGSATLGANISLTSAVTDLGTGTAVSGTHYTFAAGQMVTFNTGDGNGTVKNVTLTAINNSLIDGDHTVKLELQALNTTLNGQASLGNTDDTVTIKDDDGPPTVTSIDDGDADNFVFINSPMTYTITFSKDIDITTVDATDFDNAAGAGAASITIGAISETGPTTGIVTVQVTPTTAGNLTLRIKSGAVIKDTAGNALATPVTDNDTVQAVIPTASVSGVLFIDYDADAVQDANEAGVAGRTVFLDKNGDGVAGAGEPTATTGGNGAYAFTGLTPGSYTLRLATIGFEQGVGPNGQGANLALAPGDARTGVNLGLRVITAVSPLPVDSQVFAGSYPDDQTALIQGYYHALLGREGDAAGVSFWVNLLRATSRPTVIQGFLTSDEFYALQIQKYYQVLLSRAADPSEVGVWAGQMRAGLSSSELAIRLMTSTQFATMNPTSAAFVDSLYRLLLSREADAGGRAFWIGLLDNGQATREGVIREFFNAGESRMRAVDATHAQLLERPVVAGEYGFYVPTYSTGAGLNQGFIAILSSQEFLDRITF